jgi:hypothetical protein
LSYREIPLPDSCRWCSVEWYAYLGRDDAMKRFVRTLAALSLLFAALGGGSAAASQGEDARSEHQRIVDYWTPERVGSATPRIVVVDRVPAGAVPFVRPENPGGGNGGGGGGKPGGGGGGDGTVNGKHWTGEGGVVKTTGKVLFTLGGTNYVCSGSVVDDTDSSTSLVLTAGHCTYDDTANYFASNWMFVPDFEGGDGTFNCAAVLYGCWTARALITTEGFADGDLSFDVGFAVLPSNGAGEQLDGLVGSQAIAFNQTFPTSVHAFGYPHAKPYDGSELTYCAGPTSPDPFGSGDYGLECKMTGGSSGGPWFGNFTDGDDAGILVSVNSFKYRLDKATMYGPYFGQYAQKTYNSAIGGAGNALVLAP